jgi:hypothetical protein
MTQVAWWADFIGRLREITISLLSFGIEFVGA